MKKLSLLFTLFAFAILFTSCRKTKPYEPKEKISKIYIDYGYNGKEIHETWNWEGDKLRSIDHHQSSEGTDPYTEIFTYNEKGNVILVENSSNSAKQEYIYDKNNRLYRITSIMSEDIPVVFHYTFKYDDNELSEIDVILKEYGNKSDVVKNIFTPIKHILPELSLVSTENFFDNVTAEKADVRVMEIDIEWVGKNISEIEIESAGNKEHYYFAYDEMENPFRNFLGLGFDELCNFANKNNVVKTRLHSTNIFGDNNTETYDYHYTYDGKLPVSKNQDNITFYYEYK